MKNLLTLFSISNSHFEQKNFSTPAEKFQHSCKNCIPRFQRNSYRENNFVTNVWFRWSFFRLWAEKNFLSTENFQHRNQNCIQVVESNNLELNLVFVGNYNFSFVRESSAKKKSDFRWNFDRVVKNFIDRSLEKCGEKHFFVENTCFFNKSGWVRTKHTIVITKILNLSLTFKYFHRKLFHVSPNSLRKVRQNIVCVPWWVFRENFVFTENV